MRGLFENGEYGPWTPARRLTISPAAIAYLVTVASDNAAASVIRSSYRRAGSASWAVSPALGTSTYYWRVPMMGDNGELAAWSPIRWFRVLATLPLSAVSAAAQSTNGGGEEIRVNLASAARVAVVISNIAGREIAFLTDQDLPEGTSTLLWSGKSSTGTPVPPGRYLLKVLSRSPSGAETQTTVPLLR